MSEELVKEQRNISRFLHQLATIPVQYPFDYQPSPDLKLPPLPQISRPFELRVRIKKGR